MRALSDGRRRRILLELREQESVDPFSGVGDDRERAIPLHHVHLPLLEARDLVTWNRDIGTVRRGDAFEAVEPVLAALEARRDVLPDGYLPDEADDCMGSVGDPAAGRIDRTEQ